MHFTIMNAKDILTGKKKSSVKDILGCENFAGKDFTIYVAQRETSPGKRSKIFITSCGRLGEITRVNHYTQDTGNGYRNKGHLLIVENVILVKNGKIKESSKAVDSDEKRQHWVCK